MFDVHEMKRDLKILILELGEYLREGYNSKDKNVTHKSGADDLLTKYDVEINERIVQYLGENYPDFSIISEELPDIKKNSDYCFLIDPIDGTRNFVRNIPAFYIGIALAKDDKVILSMTYNPILDELFWAIKGEGAYMNERKIHVSDKKLSSSDVSLGYRKDKDINRKMYADIVDKIYTIKKGNSNHNDTVCIACQRNEGFLHKGSKPWDYCHYLIVEEAGGKVTDWKGEEFDLSKDNIIASNGVIHNELLKIVN